MGQPHPATVQATPAVKAVGPDGSLLDRTSDSKPEVDDVAVLHEVLLALEAQLPRLAALGNRPRRDVLGHRGGCLRLDHVQNDEERPEREEREAGELRALLGAEAEGAEWPPRLQLGHDPLEQRLLPLVALLPGQPL